MNPSSLAVASTFWIGIIGAILAAIAVLFLKEMPLRTSWETPTKITDATETPAQADSTDERRSVPSSEGAQA